MTQTILGAGGQIAVELARELGRTRTGELRLVSRNPRAVNDTDTLARADLTDAEQTRAAIAGSDSVYFTAGLPPKTELWEAQFPAMLGNALDAARAAGSRFAYFDNTYMYPQDDRVQTEGTAFAPFGRKGRVRAEMANMVLAEMERGDIPVLIARAPEFYGPGRTQGFTNSLVIDRMKAGKRPLVPVRADRRRSLIWTPDASRGLAALGNAPDAYGQTWHLPVDDSLPTYRQFVDMAAAEFGTDGKYTVLPEWALSAAGIVSPEAREIRELLPRYASDNVFDATKFRARFPDFRVTTYREGLGIIRNETERSARDD
ncbi:NAD-dependent epimerase/dehydratase family protein [Brevibacterium album]|uniref:NAD-dependent epimerase/dehydratase family protein n=1 Tax=Brevibacterium album TaxID=417948 RepID=UPI000428D81B|nr:NAD-dependent epimerase/dehydratase family protein [Brevibacterium album]